MQSTSTHFCLTFEAREIEEVVIEEFFSTSFYDYSFEELCQDILVMERQIGAFVLK